MHIIRKPIWEIGNLTRVFQDHKKAIQVVVSPPIPAYPINLFKVIKCFGKPSLAKERTKHLGYESKHKAMAG